LAIKRVSVFLPVLVMLCLILTGCGGSGQKEAGQQGKSEQVKEISVDELFSRGKQVQGMSYDYILTAPSGTMSGKVWLQGSKIKTETTIAGQHMISFFDRDTNTVITYYPDQNKAVKLSAGSRQKNVQTPSEYTGGVDPAKSKIVETVVYDGARCRVVAVTGADGREEMRLWVREDCGLPVRVEVTSASGEKTVMEYKNLQVGSLPTETFELPQGVEVTDINKMMERLPVSSGTYSKQP